MCPPTKSGRRAGRGKQSSERDSSRRAGSQLCVKRKRASEGRTIGNSSDSFRSAPKI